MIHSEYSSSNGRKKKKKKLKRYYRFFVGQSLIFLIKNNKISAVTTDFCVLQRSKADISNNQMSSCRFAIC